MREQKMFSTQDWNRLGCKIIRGILLIICLPLIVLAWISRFIDDYVSDIVYWLDDRVNDVCWHYVKWRKRDEKGN